MRSHFDAIEVRVPAAPRDDEIVMAALSCGGRPLPGLEDCAWRRQSAPTGSV